LLAIIPYVAIAAPRLLHLVAFEAKRESGEPCRANPELPPQLSAVSGCQLLILSRVR